MAKKSKKYIEALNQIEKGKIGKNIETAAAMCIL